MFFGFNPCKPTDRFVNFSLFKVYGLFMSNSRDSEATRRHLLEVSAEEMRLHGFKAASLSKILEKAEVSKGALYHHFANKQALGYAVFDEIYAEEYLTHWRNALSHPDMVEGIRLMIEGFEEHCSIDDIMQGCPVNSLSQEMSATDEGFQQCTSNMYKTHCDFLMTAIEKGIENKQLKADLPIEQTAWFIISSFQGIGSIVKSCRSSEQMYRLHGAFIEYLRSLKA